MPQLLTRNFLRGEADEASASVQAQLAVEAQVKTV